MVTGTPFFDDFNRLTALVLGDVMVDRYLRGKVERISPEAPVPVVSYEGEENRLGGAANVALNIRAMGATPILCSVVGEDAYGDSLLELLPGAGLDAQGILRSHQRRTTFKTRVMASGQQLVRIDREHTHELLPDEADRLIQVVTQLLDQQSIDLILFQDYNKGVLSPRVIEAVIAEARRRHIPTAVDPKFRNFFAYRGVTLFKPNFKEVQDQTPAPLQAELASLAEASAFLRSKLQHQHTLITLSEKGLFFDANGQQEILPTYPRSIADVCGAGDTVISVAALGLALGMEMREIAKLANLAGGQVCERVGVVPVNKEQLVGEYRAVSRNPVAAGPRANS